MEETNPELTFEAIKLFKERHGIKAPLTVEGMDEIIIELKEKINNKKKKGRKK